VRRDSDAPPANDTRPLPSDRRHDFFALSGYLITALVLAEHGKTGRIELKAFWIRRGRRLLPALFVLVAPFLAYHLVRVESDRQSRLP
jgi:peptidoglycan/LPS O-acetylase OafA/YrhL